ncbi:aldolase [Anaerosporomusa subterranea]|uniref:Aldolase n=1 Tax=Anaerosporomusa subterranea TaxID=1794912 RepID=A0A154BT31_ANASB|nr:class II aldolase/adducin family protein [Anaerosporomusa subterranea]KYZ77163.1 aldolase [Anaerosporomusa subterranea]
MTGKDIRYWREKILETGIYLLDKGLVTGTWGNISVRISENLFAITPSGRNYRTIQPDDIVIVNASGETVEGHLSPSSELPLHLAVYAARPDIGGIVHTHSVFASACAVSRRAIPPIIEDLVQLAGGEISVAPYALPGTQQLADNAVHALASKFAVLLANHGVVACGKTLNEAMTAAELVEKAAQIFSWAQLLGGAVPLSEEDVAGMHSFYLEHYRQRQGG